MEEFLGTEHPKVAELLCDQANLLQAQVCARWKGFHAVNVTFVPLLLIHYSLLHRPCSRILSKRSLCKLGSGHLQTKFVALAASTRWNRLGSFRFHWHNVLRHCSTLTLPAIQGKYSDAQPIFKRSENILKRVNGPNDPSVASVLNNRADMFMAQVGLNRGTRQGSVVPCANKRVLEVDFNHTNSSCNSPGTESFRRIEVDYD